METNFAKVLDSGRNAVVDLKRKRSAICETILTGVAGKVLSQLTASNSNIDKLGKRMKLDGSKSKCGTCASRFRKDLLTYYSNFTRSGVPQRLMFYENGEWGDFPKEFIGLIKKDLQVKKAAIEVDFNGHPFLLDLLHMIRLDLTTGLRQPIAWIDEEGKCFFPEMFSVDDKLYDCCHHDFGKDKEHLLSEPHGYQDIRLQLEIEVNGSDHSKFKEYSGESNVLVKKIQVGGKSSSDHCGVEVDGGSVKPSDTKGNVVLGGNQHREKNLVARVNGIHGEMNSNKVREIFLSGMGSFTGEWIVDINHGSSTLMQARLELFHKQAEITEKYRGDANVLYAWLPSSKEVLASVMMYGLENCGTPEIKSTHGIGVHLSPANCSITSAIYCDVDENGMRHMVFCRVIMGNMELIPAGSKQSHPSSEEFDSGVDDLQNPRNYVVWNMNKNTHIYPEYAVSFKGSSEGFLDGNRSKLDISKVQIDLNSSPAHQRKLAMPSVQLDLNSPPAQLVPAANQGARIARIPRSPWMPFPLLFVALSKKVPPNVMKLIQANYCLFTSKKITRGTLIQRLRLLVGDTLLRSILTNIQSKERNIVLVVNDAKQNAEEVKSEVDQESNQVLDGNDDEGDDKVESGVDQAASKSK